MSRHMVATAFNRTPIRVPSAFLFVSSLVHRGLAVTLKRCSTLSPACRAAGRRRHAYLLARYTSPEPLSVATEDTDDKTTIIQTIFMPAPVILCSEYTLGERIQMNVEIHGIKSFKRARGHAGDCHVLDELWSVALRFDTYAVNSRLEHAHVQYIG